MSEKAISEEEKARRHEIVDEGIQSAQAQGLMPCEEFWKNMRLLAEGLITIEEVEAQILAPYRAKAGRPHT